MKRLSLVLNSSVTSGANDVLYTLQWTDSCEHPKVRLEKNLVKTFWFFEGHLGSQDAYASRSGPHSGQNVVGSVPDLVMKVKSNRIT